MFRLTAILPDGTVWADETTTHAAWTLDHVLAHPQAYGFPVGSVLSVRTEA